MKSMIINMFCFLAISVSMNSVASGILGQAIKDIGNAVGSKELKDLGEAADNAHKDLKEAIPVYGDVEEGITHVVKELTKGACNSAFHLITKPVIVHCANWGKRMDNRELINNTINLLVNKGYFGKDEFAGVEIRWCPLVNAAGMVPDRDKLLLDDDYMSTSPRQLAPLLAHEMVHIRQYRKKGTNDFKCQYSEQYAKCGCQNKGHPLEKEAYEFQEKVSSEI